MILSGLSLWRLRLDNSGPGFSASGVNAAADYNGVLRIAAENPMPIEKNQVVLFHYSVSDEQGKVGHKFADVDTNHSWRVKP